MNYYVSVSVAYRKGFVVEYMHDEWVVRARLWAIFARPETSRRLRHESKHGSSPVFAIGALLLQSKSAAFLEGKPRRL
jgi:hypothetical protein